MCDGIPAVSNVDTLTGAHFGRALRVPYTVSTVHRAVRMEERQGPVLRKTKSRPGIGRFRRQSVSDVVRPAIFVRVVVKRSTRGNGRTHRT